MAKPHLTGHKFPHLHTKPGSDSHGTVTGDSGMATGHKVEIAANGGGHWSGMITDAAGGNDWKAVVQPSRDTKEERKGTDQITVTVTNPGGETSDPVGGSSDVIP